MPNLIQQIGDLTVSVVQPEAFSDVEVTVFDTSVLEYVPPSFWCPKYAYVTNNQLVAAVAEDLVELSSFMKSIRDLVIADKLLGV
jgi:hypothetical protein